MTCKKTLSHVKYFHIDVDPLSQNRILVFARVVLGREGQHLLD